MSAILLCLEEATKDKPNVALEPDCLAELYEVRRSLMEDFQINPLLVRSCSHEIAQHCDGHLHRDGRTIHCLMDLARARPNRDGTTLISVGCARALEDVLTEVDIGENYDIDPVLREQCDDVVRSSCSHVKPGDGRVINCLLSSVDKSLMNPGCKEALMEVYYFISRDFRLDPRLYKFCRRDAIQLCGARENWHRVDDGKAATAPSSGPLVLSCLFQRITHINEDDDDDDVNDEDDNRNFMQGEQQVQQRRQKPEKTVSRQCTFEVRRVMHDRARSVNLEPMIEQSCLNDLAAHCSERTGKSQEMTCLEDNLKQLSPGCQKVVKKYIKEVDEDPQIDELFAQACAPFWEKHCQHALAKAKDDKENENDDSNNDSDEEVADSLMMCLIQFKYHPDMDDKCRIGVEHHQLITLQNYEFSRDFKRACQQNIVELCFNGTRRNLKKDSESVAKQAVVKCLSEQVRKDTLTDSTQHVSKACRKQLKFELLQRSENIKLDPDLQEACSEDVKMHCKNVSPGKAAVVECLRKHQQVLEDKCHVLIFKREEEEANDPSMDFLLVSKCKSMIKKYCVEEMMSPATIFSCLLRNKDEDNFDHACLKTVILRGELRAKDIRLNPELMKHCRKDVKAFCATEQSQLLDKESEGKVLLCMRRQYVMKKLSHSCSEYVRDMIKESARDYKQDVPLASKCSKEIENFCGDLMTDDGAGIDNGRVEECLKEHVAKKEITSDTNLLCFLQISRVMEENQFDIQSDVVLYRACSSELKDHCSDVPAGEGRKVACLMTVLNAKKQDLAKDCQKLLEQRISLWNFIVTAKPPESMQEFAQFVVSSPSKNHILAFLLCSIAVIFIVGLCCGRVTKRVRRELKNR
jgi:Golgi apparatus protein 1